MLVKAELEALPRHSGYGAKQPVEDAEFAVVGAVRALPLNRM